MSAKRLVPAVATSTSVVFAASMLLGACASHPPPPDWQANVKTATERSVAAYLVGNARVEQAEIERARTEAARTGRVDLLARVELARCAGVVASLVFEPCSAFERLRADAGAPARAYADYLSAKPRTADVALLPDAQRAIAGVVASNAAFADTGTAATLRAIDDPLSRLVAAGVLLEAGLGDPGVIAQAIDTASAQGWRRPLLAWLGVQLRRAESAGDVDEAARLRRRIGLVQGAAP